jgi:peptidoglycan/LPS O-acetylase OafA/YrhL
MGHFGAPPLPSFVDKTTTPGLLAIGVYNNLTSGPAAVIVFFVISGLCIHYPNANPQRLPRLLPYFVRRYVRIILPMLAAIGMAHWQAGVSLALFEQTILWSLLAELIYYTLYPVLLALRRASKGWSLMIAVSFIAALAVASTNPSAGDYPSFGIQLNWLLGLPCWLLGCELAERIRNATDAHPGSRIWLWRAAVFISAAACSVARFHSPLGYPWTLNFLAILASIWLYYEALYYRQGLPCYPIEWAGSWSYSLYLVHPVAFNLMRQHTAMAFDSLLRWIAMMVFILAFSYAFALMFEFPAHRVARHLASRLSGKGLRHSKPSRPVPRVTPA